MATSISAPAAVPLTSQVGGHAGVMASADGAMIMKACLPNEKKFYEAVVSEPGFERLRGLVPKFFGTLKLEGQVEEGEGGKEVKPLGGEGGSLVLENLSHRFNKPNILDMKLGTVLYDDSANEVKKERMIQTAKETTSFEAGVRLTGFQVYDATTGEFVNTPKSYGKSIKIAQLPEGIAKFFPVPKDRSTHGVPAPLLLRVMEGILSEIEEIQEAVKETEMRMVGGSVLIVWEGDEETLEKAFAEVERKDAEGDDEGEESEESEDEGSVGPPFKVKMIDFAHTKLVPGEGPDKGVLLGLGTAVQLLKQRIGAVGRGEH